MRADARTQSARGIVRCRIAHTSQSLFGRESQSQNQRSSRLRQPVVASLQPPEGKWDWLGGETRCFAFKEPLHILPGQRDKHVGHRVFIGIFEPGQRFQDVRQAVAHVGVFLLKPFERCGKAVWLRHGVEIDEIPFRSTACYRAQFHTGDVAGIGQTHAEEGYKRKEHRIGVGKKADFDTLNCRVQGFRGLRCQSETGEGLQPPNQRFGFYRLAAEKIEVMRVAVSEVECKAPCPRQGTTGQGCRLPGDRGGCARPPGRSLPHATRVLCFP